MDILNSIGYQVSRQVTNRVFKKYDEHNAKHISNDNSIFQKNLRNYKMPGKEQTCLSKWIELISQFEAEYRISSNTERVKQAEIYLESNIRDLDGHCEIIRNYYTEIYPECQRLLNNARQRVLDSL
jgi:hypothetical protein